MKILAVLIVFLISFSVILSGCGGTAEPEGTVTLDLDDEPFDLSRDSYAVYNTHNSVTWVYGYGEARQALDIYFPGASTGTFEIPTGEGRVRYLNEVGRSFFTDDRHYEFKPWGTGQEQHVYEEPYYIINVTAYGAVGEPIEGTFEAVLTSGVGGTGTGGTKYSYPTISGSFSVIRRADT